MASRPELDSSGWVWPSLNAPHSGCPNAPQPLALGRHGQQVLPAEALARPAQRLGHRLPQSDHDRRQQQRLTGGRHRLVPPGPLLPGVVQQREVRARCRADHVGLQLSAQHRLHRLARPHGLGLHPHRPPGQAGIGGVEGSQLFLQPALLLAAVSDDQSDRVGRRRRFRRGGRGCGGLPGWRRRRFLATAERGCQHQQHQRHPRHVRDVTTAARALKVTALIARRGT